MIVTRPGKSYTTLSRPCKLHVYRGTANVSGHRRRNLLYGNVNGVDGWRNEKHTVGNVVSQMLNKIGNTFEFVFHLGQHAGIINRSFKFVIAQSRISEVYTYGEVDLKPGTDGFFSSRNSVKAIQPDLVEANI